MTQKPSEEQSQDFYFDFDAPTAKKENVVKQTNLQHGWTAEMDGGEMAFFPHIARPPACGLPAGNYEINIHKMRGVYFKEKELLSDKLIMIEGSAADHVVREVRAFMDRKAEFAKRGFLHKRGILMLGAPGAGKTVTLQQVGKVVAKEFDGIVLYSQHVGLIQMGVQRMRDIEKNRFILMVIEDIDYIVEEGDEEGLLSLLDGENQVDNIVYIATTNYPEKLPERILDRPSRFDSVVWVDLPNERMRAEFLKEKEPEYTKHELEKIVKLTEGFTIAHLKEFIILNKCFGQAIDVAAARIKDSTGKKFLQRKEKK